MNQSSKDLYGEEELDLDNFGCPLPYASSARSFSTESCAQPYTPQSGRSTPQQRAASLDMDLDQSMGYEPVIALDGYFSGELKTELGLCDGLPMTPNQKPLKHAQQMDFDHSQFLGSFQSQSCSLDFANPQILQHYSFPNTLQSSPYGIPPPPYSLHNPACDTSSLWAYPGPGHMGFLDNSASTDLPAASVRQVALPEADAIPTSYQASNGKRSARVAETQVKTSAVHRAHGRGQNHLKRRRGLNIQHFPPGAHKCYYPECKANKGFKRSEHLKRHIKTIHRTDPKEGCIKCEFCDKSFNRHDNYRSHVRLHTEKNKETSRTLYYPQALAFYNELVRQTKQRRQKEKPLAKRGTRV